MIYTLDFNIPANTAVTSRAKDILYVVKGLVYKIEFKYPPGCAGLAHVCLNVGAFQIWPSTPGNYFASDDETISFDDVYEIKSNPAQFAVYGYNEDTVHDHTIYIRCGLVSKLEYKARFLPSYASQIREIPEKEPFFEDEKTNEIIELVLPFRKR